jgi:hypothetical protein
MKNNWKNLINLHICLRNNSIVSKYDKLQSRTEYRPVFVGVFIMLPSLIGQYT